MLRFSGRLQRPRAERPAGCSAKSQMQCGEQQHSGNKCRVCGPHWRPSPHDRGGHLWGRCGNHNHRNEMGHHISHPLPTGEGGAGQAVPGWSNHASKALSGFGGRNSSRFLSFVDSKSYPGGAGQESGDGPLPPAQWQGQFALPWSHHQGSVTDPSRGPSFHPPRCPQWHQVHTPMPRRGQSLSPASFPLCHLGVSVSHGTFLCFFAASETSQ